MAKFNTTSSGTFTGTNLAGGVSYSRTFKNEIVSVILSSMLNGDSFYQTEAERIKYIEELLESNLENPELAKFMAQAMIYTRTEANLRSVSHLLAIMLVEVVKDTNYLRNALYKTMIRPDDLTEMVALWDSRHPDVMVPNSLRRAICDSLTHKWTGYHFKKYEGLNNKIKLKDVIKLSRPSPMFKEDPDVFKKVLEGTLENIDTAQTVNAGNTGKDRAAKYENMLADGTLGYMAAMKNIVNMLEANISSTGIQRLYNLLTDENAVLKSKVLPFRYLDALEALKESNLDAFKVQKIRDALEVGFTISSRNVNFVDGDEKIALLLDESWSMNGTPFNVGMSLMASCLAGLPKGQGVGYLWATTSRLVNIDSSPFSFIESTHCRGGGTDVAAPLNSLIANKTYVDKIIIFTDMQLYDTRRSYSGLSRITVKNKIDKYRNEVNPDVKVLFWNLAGYPGGAPISASDGMLEVSGWSSNLLEVASNMLNTGETTYLVSKIEDITL